MPSALRPALAGQLRALDPFGAAIRLRAAWRG